MATPSGRYEGDTLVIDTVGCARIGRIPYRPLRHTLYREAARGGRHRMVDYDEAKDAMARGTRRNRRAGAPITHYGDKYLKVDFTTRTRALQHPVERCQIYLRDREPFPENRLCRRPDGFHNDEGAQIPTAAKPDFLSGGRTLGPKARTPLCTGPVFAIVSIASAPGHAAGQA